MVRTILMLAVGVLLGVPVSALAAEEKKGEIASEVSTGATGADGVRKSKDSDWTEFTVPDGFIINKEKTNVEIVSERGSEHTFNLAYEDDVEIISGTGIKQLTTIKVMTHARSEKGAGGGGGGMKVKVTFYSVKYK
jgi:hypothetical protein